MYRQTLIQGEVYKNTNKTHREALVKQINVQLVEKCIIKVNHLYNFFLAQKKLLEKQQEEEKKKLAEFRVKVSLVMLIYI